MNAKILRRLELLDTKARRLRIKGQRSDVNSEINVTPLVDVVLVLLIIFMLVLPKLSVVIQLPKQLRPDRVREVKDALNIIVKKDGSITVNVDKVDEKNLPAALAKELKKNPFRRVLLSADAGLQFHTIRMLLGALRDAGVTQADLLGKRIAEEQ